MKDLLHIGIDIGSTTVKIAVLDNLKHCLHACYVRHYTDIRQKVWDLLENAYEIFGDRQITMAITGSGGIALADYLGITFIQEVIAGTKAVRTYHPQSDVIIELGGEDAKITYLTGGNEHRMNGNCAGGTGAFIDQMATLLHTDASGLNALAEKADTLYPIAARCGVFAKTDVQALMNDGASKENVAASVFQSIVLQTITGLACGRPIRGTVCFLGGPLTFLPQLRKQFAETLHLTPEQVVAPENAQVYVAIGAALGSFQEKPLSFMNLMGQLRNVDESSLAKSDRVEPLFASQAEFDEFRSRHGQHTIPSGDLAAYSGPCYLGVDAGSTTIKVVLLSEDNKILYSHYQNNEGSPLAAAKKIITEIYSLMPPGAFIAKAGITGYGEFLLKEALHLDLGEVETIAHYQAAAHFCPDVDFILDIGGQDMKCSRLKDGHIEDILLNEACSSGCGSFLDTFAKSLNLSIQDFAKAALFAESPIDLGSRCTVFMNSKVTQAQKEGMQVSDIAAGLCYSVVRNALDKVLRIKSVAELGEHVVVQGGAFLNDALLCAMERTLGHPVYRPALSGLMGAFGAALSAQETLTDTRARSPLSGALIRSLVMRTRSFRCRDCGNHCLLTETRFSHGTRHIAGNRCDRFSESRRGAAPPAPNLFAWKNQRLFRYEPLPEDAAPRGRLGIPRVLNMYTHYPFWFTLFTNLGYRVEVSPPTNRALFAAGLTSVPSQSVCYPAKLAHGHVLALLDRGIKHIFFPCIPREAQEFPELCDTFSCPVACGYPQVVRENLPELAQAGAVLHAPFVNLTHTASLVRNLCREFGLPRAQVRAAVRLASQEQRRYWHELRTEANRIYDDVRRNHGSLVVLAGRPYHVDPQVHHGLPEFIAGLGAAVISEDAIPHGGMDSPLLQGLRVRNQWTYPARLYRAAAWVGQANHAGARVELVQITSFGCGLDAITTDQVRELLRASGKLYTLIKMDEGNALASARIRIRSLLAVTRSRSEAATAERAALLAAPTAFTRHHAASHTILVPQMAPLHFPLLVEALEGEGHQVRLLPEVSARAVDLGQAYVNNDACYPAIVAIGQLLEALCDGHCDPARTALLFSQTCGPCRASNYPGMLRKALRECGFPQVPVLRLSSSGANNQPGFRPSRALLGRMVLGMLGGDMLQRLSLFTGTHERHKGDTEDRTQAWLRTLAPSVRKGDVDAFQKQMPRLLRDFEQIPLDVAPRPRVAVVGEILLTYHEDANKHIVSQIRQEGGEPLLPDLTNFMLYCLMDSIYDWRAQGGATLAALGSALAIRRVEKLRRGPRALLASSPLADKIMPVAHIDGLAQLGEQALSLGNAAGEGWLLPAEMLEFMHHGVNNVLCLQPFGCLPNHVVGRGSFKTVRRLHEEANIMAIDYDPGSSEANQLNRIRLFMALAKERRETQEAPQPAASPVARTRPVAERRAVARRTLSAAISLLPQLAGLLPG